MMTHFVVAVLALFLVGVTSFGMKPRIVLKPTRSMRSNGASSLTAVFDVIAGLALQNTFDPSQLSTRSPVASTLSSSSLPVAVVETKQGLYKEYTVDRVDDSYLDEVRSTYKTAEQTEENKTKYWALFAVLVFGSFVIPMVQYYWYVAEED